MALLRGLAKFQAMRNLLGFDEDPLQDVKSIQQIRSSQQTRDLAERKFRYDQGRDQQKDYFDRTKFVFTQLASVYSSTPEGDPRREYLRQMTENFKFALPKDMQLALGATELLRSISPEERRRTEWRRANPRPKATVGADGQPLPWNEENADTIAGDKLRAAKWEYFDKTVAFGVETGKVISPPQGWLSPPVGEGVKSAGEGGKTEPPPRRYYFNHKDTGQMMSVDMDQAGVGVTTAELRERGSSWPDVAMKGSFPTTKPVMATVGGANVQVTPRRSFMTGKIKNEVTPVGASKPQNAPAILDNAWVTAASGSKEALESLEGPTKALAEAMLEPVRWTTWEDIRAQEERVNSLLEGIPGWKMFLDYGVDPKTGGIVPGRKARERGWLRRTFGDDARYEFEDFPWKLVPVSGTVELSDGTNTATFHQGVNKQGQPIAIQKNGDKVPKSEGATNGDIVEDIEIPAPSVAAKISEHFRKRNLATSEGLFAIERRTKELHKRFTAWSKKTGGSAREFMDKLDEQADETGRWLIEGMGPAKAAEYVESIGRE